LANHDIFHSDRLEVERNLSDDALRAGLASGEIREDDLVRPAGTTAPWARIGDRPDLFTAKLVPKPKPKPPAPHVVPAPPPPPPELVRHPFDDDDLDDGADVIEPIYEAEFADDEEDGEDFEEEASNQTPALGPLDSGEHDVVPVAAGNKAGADLGELDLDLDRDRHEQSDDDPSSQLVVAWDDDLDEYDPQEEDEAAAEFTLSRGSAETVEELDLAAMVDVAFQLVLFFLVTATTVLYKSLEVPKPNPDSNPPAAAAQGRSKSLDDLKGQFILVEIDPAGHVKIDHEPVAAEPRALAERLRAARKDTDRNSMLLSADFSTPHQSAVLAYDAANEIGLGIAIARPTQNQ
jgi:biopolymer transport protein ExbD